MDDDGNHATLNLIKDVVKTCFLMLYYILQSWVNFFYTPRKDLTGEIVLLTGGAGDLGKLMSEKLVQKGCYLILWDINEGELRKHCDYLNEKYGVNNKVVAYYYNCDITNEREVLRISETLIDKIGHPTIVINNAAIVMGKYFMDLTLDEVRKVYDVNVISQYQIAKIFLPQMLKDNRGHIVCISSILATDTFAGVAEYGPSKAAVWNFMKSLRQEIRLMGRDNVHCTSVLPFHLKAQMFKGCIPTSNGLFESLCPNYVSDKIVDAIEKNQIMLYLPRLMYFLTMLNTILPEKARDVATDIMGVNVAMQTFTGRNTK